MGTSRILIPQRRDLREPVRNRFYYGKLMDVYHFELETGYMNSKRWLINRLVCGYGVVCGLDVNKHGSVENHIKVAPGVAIDKWGREIIVPSASPAISIPDCLLPPIPEEPSGTGAEAKSPELPTQPVEAWVHVVIAYHECLSDPGPALASDCSSTVACEAGAIRERYKVEVRKGKAEPPAIDIKCRFPDVISQGMMDYAELTRWVTEGCPAPAKDPSITLANICLRYNGQDGYVLAERDIDITVRRIVYSNDLLFDLLTSLLTEDPKHRRGK